MRRRPRRSPSIKTADAWCGSPTSPRAAADASKVHTEPLAAHRAVVCSSPGVRSLMRGFVCRAFTVGEQPGVPEMRFLAFVVCAMCLNACLYPAPQRRRCPGWLLRAAPKRHQGLRRRLRTSDRLL